MIDGVKDKFLLNPVVVDARTEITTGLLAEAGYSVTVEDDDGELHEQTFFGKDFEKKFFSDETNEIFCQTFLKNAFRDPLSGEIGKSIIFCVRQDHATRITKKLNELTDVIFPGKYNSDFAVQVTSSVTDPQQMSASFANNNLNGHTRLLDGYISSKTRVCVTVGMMTTGYDCEDLLNVVLLRPVFSPTDFIQIKGRGTRKYTFRFAEKDGAQVTQHEKAKEAFRLFDFFVDHLLTVPGMGLAKGAQILSAFELARRQLIKETVKIECAKDVLPLVADIASKPQEHFVCISLNGANEVIEKRVVTIGLLDKTSVHPREVFADVIADRASAVILVHNHPSGDTQPSEADRLTHDQLTEAAKLLGLRVLDNIIVSRKGYFSFQESGLVG